MKRLLFVLLFVAGVANAQIGTQTNTDNFNRANETPMTGNWTPTTYNAGLMALAGNTVVPQPLSVSQGAFYNAWTGGNDQYSQAEITVTDTLADGSGLGVCVRQSGTSSVRTFYEATIDSTGLWNLFKAITGAYTFLISGTVTYVAGQKLGLSVQGTTLKVWYNGTQVGTTTDSSISTGFPGLQYENLITTGSIDNWDAGTVSGGGGATPMPSNRFFLFPQ